MFLLFIELIHASQSLTALAHRSTRAVVLVSDNAQAFTSAGFVTFWARMELGTCEYLPTILPPID